MSEPQHVVLGINDEGYFRKFFKISPDTSLKKLLASYRSNICSECSRVELLEFWYDTIKIEEEHTPRSLAMQTGDMIDVRISVPITRCSCPLPQTQTIPNLHYLTECPAAKHGVQELASGPAEPVSRISFTLRDQNGAELALRVKTNTPFEKVLNAYAQHTQREARTCRMLLDGVRLAKDQTPEGIEMEEGDVIDVFIETFGGGDGGGRGWKAVVCAMVRVYWRW